MSATIISSAAFRVARQLREIERLALGRPVLRLVHPEMAVVLPSGHPAGSPRSCPPRSGPPRSGPPRSGPKTPSAVVSGDTVRIVAPLGNGRSGFVSETEWREGRLWVTVKSAGHSIRIAADLLEVVR